MAPKRPRTIEQRAKSRPRPIQERFWAPREAQKRSKSGPVQERPRPVNSGPKEAKSEPRPAQEQSKIGPRADLGELGRSWHDPRADLGELGQGWQDLRGDLAELGDSKGVTGRNGRGRPGKPLKVEAYRKL